MKKQLPYSIIIFVSVSFFSCQDWNEYRVKSDFEPYVVRFEMEAKQRGEDFHLRERGLIIEFGDLDNGVAGLCHYGKPIRIEIDRAYWNEMGKYGGADLIREELIFHEMGHGILGRKHLNTTLSNDEWKSIMCGGNKVEDRSWNTNYRGQRRAYYLDELFTESTAEPSFFTLPPVIDSEAFIPVLTDNFDSASSSLWKPGIYPGSSVSIENGMLIYRSKSTANMAVLSEIPHFNIQSDFILEYTFQYKEQADSAKYGIAFGTLANSGSYKESVDFFVINNNRQLYNGNTTWYSYFTQVKRYQIIPKGKNKLKIIQSGNMLSCYINDVFAYASETENTQPGSGIGFMVPAGQTLYVDDLRLSKRTTAAAAARIRKSLTDKLNFTPVMSIINEIKNNK